MGNGWSEAAFYQDDDFNMTRIGPVSSSSDSSISSHSSSESEESSSSMTEAELDETHEKEKAQMITNNVLIVKGQKEVETKVTAAEPMPSMTPEMMLLQGIRKATAARDEKECHIVSVMNLYITLQSEVYQMNYDLVLANQEYARIYGKNAMDEIKKYEENESTA